MAASGVQVTGVRETVRKLERLGAEVSDLRAAFQRVGQVVVNDAKVIAPVRSGRLAGSIRAGGGKNKAVIRAGSAGIPYAGVIHYGGYHNITAQPFLTDALEHSQTAAIRTLDNELSGIVRGLNLT